METKTDYERLQEAITEIRKSKGNDRIKALSVMSEHFIKYMSSLDLTAFSYRHVAELIGCPKSIRENQRTVKELLLFMQEKNLIQCDTKLKDSKRIAPTYSDVKAVYRWDFNRIGSMSAYTNDRSLRRLIMSMNNTANNPELMKNHNGTYAHMMRKNGYNTRYFYKWVKDKGNAPRRILVGKQPVHVGHDVEFTFDDSEVKSSKSKKQQGVKLNTALSIQLRRLPRITPIGFKLL